MYVIGIDLSGPSNFKDTSVAAFMGNSQGVLALHKSLAGADDPEIFSFIKALPREENIVIGVDAPLSYNMGGGDRPGDAALRLKVIAAGLRSGSVMTPTMTRMVYLTLRGIAVTRLLQAASPKAGIVEVHPGAAMVLRGADVGDVAAMKNNPQARRNLLAWLENQGLHGVGDVSDPTDHYVAACSAGLAAWKWHQKTPAWLFPAQPPFHPFDYAC